MSAIYEIGHFGPDLSAKQEAFLAAYVESAGNITEAAVAADISRSIHYFWAKESAAYASAFDIAEKESRRRLLDKAVELAFHGFEEPVFWNGEFSGFRYKQSERILLALLKRAFPGEFADYTKAEVTGKDGAALLPGDPGRATVSDQELKEIAALGAAIRAQAASSKDGA